jgi:hypothetical protein
MDTDADADTGGGGETSDLASYNPDFVEFVGEDCQLTGQINDVNIEKLPDLFEFIDGSRMTKKSEWKCRRAEIKAQVEHFILANPHIGHLGPTATNVAGKAGMEMYKALGAEDNYVFQSNDDNGDHCQTGQKPNLRSHLQAMIDMHLFKKSPPCWRYL